MNKSCHAKERWRETIRARKRVKKRKREKERKREREKERKREREKAFSGGDVAQLIKIQFSIPI